MIRSSIDEVALSTSDLDACVRCGLCLSSCPTFELTGMEGYSPRGRIAAVRAIEAGKVPGPVEAEYLDTCLGCRACESACPSGVAYGRIFEHARTVVRPREGLLARVLLWAIARRWRLSLLSVPLWIGQRLGIARFFRGASGIPKLRLSDLALRLSTRYVPPDGTPERGQVVLFAGCVSDAWARDVHWATIFVLTRAGYVVRVPRGQVCCGALHAHAGHAKAARELAIRNMLPLERYEGQVVASAAGCGAKLREYGEVLEHPDAEAVAGRIRDVTEVLTLEDVQDLGPVVPDGLHRIGLHEPCHLAFAQGVREQPRTLLAAAGYDVVGLGDGGRCCGAAGMYSLQQPAFAEPLREAKLAACRAVSVDAVAVGNPGCAFWMGAAADAPRMLHPAQLLAMAVSAGEEARQDAAEADKV